MILELLPPHYQSCFRMLDRNMEEYFKNPGSRGTFSFVIGTNLIMFIECATGNPNEMYLIDVFNQWIEEYMEKERKRIGKVDGQREMDPKDAHEKGRSSRRIRR